MNKPLEALFLLSGTIIGAGVLGLPFALQEVGLLIGLVLITLLGLAALALHLILIDMITHTKGKEEIAALTAYYLGDWAGPLTLILISLLSYAVLSAFIIGASEIIATLFHISTKVASILFILLLLPWLIRNEDGMGRAIYYVMILKVATFCGVIALALSQFTALTTSTNWYLFLKPYGVVLSAFLGFPVLPAVVRLVKPKKLLLPVVVGGSIIPIIFYMLFVASVLSSSFSIVPVASLGFQGAGIMPYLIINLFVMVAFITPFFGITLGLKSALQKELHLSSNESLLATILPPLSVVLLSSIDFIGLLNFLGAVLSGSLALLFLSAHSRYIMLHKRPKWLLIGNGLLAIVFLQGIVLFFL